MYVYCLRQSEVLCFSELITFVQSSETISKTLSDPALNQSNQRYPQLPTWSHTEHYCLILEALCPNSTLSLEFIFSIALHGVQRYVERGRTLLCLCWFIIYLLCCICSNCHELEWVKTMTLGLIASNDVHLLLKKYEPILPDGGYVMKVWKLHFQKAMLFTL